ncbi:MAG TPA: hypothetical protein VFK37_02605, partial [Bacillales bacterium]|nr:hypothetical protein [Bacillales bacterium]
GIYNVLNPDGTLLMSVPGRNTWKEFFEIGEELLGDTPTFAKPFLSKFDRAEMLPAAMEEAGFNAIVSTANPIPFNFGGGEKLLNFFQQLFSLLSYVPDEIKTNVSEMIDERFPNGFTMHYEAIVVQGRRPK